VGRVIFCEQSVPYVVRHYGQADTEPMRKEELAIPENGRDVGLSNTATVCLCRNLGAYKRSTRATSTRARDLSSQAFGASGSAS
jgi:hypothetical protein